MRDRVLSGVDRSADARGWPHPPIVAVLAAFLFLAPMILASVPASARPIKAGFDYFETQPGTYQDFSATPIPPDFFDPGSDPFDGTIDFLGEPLDPAVSTADTIVERQADVRPRHPFPSFDTVPIEIVALSLVSASPITVTYSGGSPEQWNVKVELSKNASQAQGNMSIVKTTSRGGTFDSLLPVTPMLTFTRVGDGAVRVLDLGEIGLRLPFQAFQVPWTHSVPRDLYESRGFCPSCADGQGVLSTEDAIIAKHLIKPAMKAP